jgi:pyridinium-3,5-biscarboxylic acid mononucleotide sulfurtransferase
MSGALERILAAYPSLLVGYSGGVDSALLAVRGRRVLGRARMLAVLGVSPSLAGDQHRRARAVAALFDVPLLEVPTRELDDPGYVANAPSRCYFCKRELWVRLHDVAAERGLAVIADGTNADDLTDHRPGLRAAGDSGVRSPLAEAGYGKDDVRREARALGIPIWDAPAAPCLASRIRYGLTVTPSRLRQVEQAETALRGLGVEGDLRVRHRGSEARIEVHPSQFPAVRRAGDRIAAQLLALGFSRITLDLGGYRRGSLLVERGDAVELLGSRE